jgi:hypothetical protein
MRGTGQRSPKPGNVFAFLHLLFLATHTPSHGCLLKIEPSMLLEARALLWHVPHRSVGHEQTSNALPF